jgi:hypothetical protein
MSTLWQTSLAWEINSSHIKHLCIQTLQKIFPYTTKLNFWFCRLCQMLLVITWICYKCPARWCPKALWIWFQMPLSQTKSQTLNNYVSQFVHDCFHCHVKGYIWLWTWSVTQLCVKPYADSPILTHPLTQTTQNRKNLWAVNQYLVPYTKYVA